MAVRSTMTDLIARVRTIINDPSGTPVFSDQDIQDVLDRRRRYYTYAFLMPRVTISVGAGTVKFLDWYSQEGDWESDAQLLDASYNVLSPTTSDLLTGHWTFLTHQPSIRITGTTYDLYGAAGELCEMWAARQMLAYDFTADGDHFNRSQMRGHLLDQAKYFRSRALPSTIDPFRSDENGGH